jgi:two-component system chemotaxis response regulator CheY
VSPSSPGVLPPPPVATVLAIDGDAVSRRFVELALGRDPEFQVEGAVDGSGALEILGKTPVHLILSDTDLADMNGLQLYRRLNQEARLRSIPFVFLSADARVTTKTVAFGAGVDDYLVKPCDGGELLARARSLIARQRRVGTALRERSYSLAGDFSALSFADLISILELGRRSGTVSIASSDRLGNAYFDHGRVVHALFGNLSGAAAFVWMMAQEDGHFEFTPGRCPIEPARHTIDQSVQSLMMESARVIDTEKATGKHFALPLPAPDAAPPAVAPSVERVPAFVPEAGVAAQLERALLDSFNLGDLMVFSPGELTSWTSRPVARDRFHVVLVADLAQGASALLAMAGAPTERWVLSSLGPDAKTMGLAFFLRQERLVDVILVDVRDPGAARENLRRCPSLFIIAPPEGDALALGIKARVELSLLVSELQPRALLGLGNPALPAAMQALTQASDGLVPRFRAGALDAATADLRSLLAEGVRLASRPPAAAAAGGGR